jgi:2-dehydro-3-deoxyphosphogluconate aldolase / (4S)-4-hydroxy-2-oxoglutarate aldolase
MRIDEILALGPVVPVIVLDDPAAAVPLANALLEGGVRVLEITLRTPAALEAIRRVRAEVPDAVVGAGTVLTPASLAEVGELGAAFAVSPGVTPALLEAASRSPVPLLPGAATASEVMALLDRGYRHMKLFPAEQVGGAPLLAALASPLPEARFCPTGGIDAEKAKVYLALPNVACVGGSWIVPREAIARGDWARIAALAREAVAGLARARTAT